MANIDKVSVKNTVYNIVSPAVVSDYIEVIGGACTKPDGYVEDEVILAKQNDVQLLFKATQTIAFGANIVENTNCVRTTLEEVLKNAGGGGGASSADQVSYDNSDSGLEAENVQEAVDELATNAGTASSQIQTLTNEVSAMVNVYGSKNILQNNLVSMSQDGVNFVVNEDKSITIDTNGQTVSVEQNGVALCHFVSEFSGDFILSHGNATLPSELKLMIEDATVHEWAIAPQTVSMVKGHTYWVWIIYNAGLNIAQASAKTIFPMLRDARIIDGFYQPYSMTNQELTPIAQAVSNRNLLDNPWFTVNQRGQSSYTTNTSYILSYDRWKIYNATLEKVSDGVKFTAKASTLCVLAQYIENFETLNGKIVTLSAIINDKLVTTTGKFVINGTGIRLTVSTQNNEYYLLELIMSANDNVPRVVVCTYTTTPLTIEAVKLELGSVSTLAQDTAPNYQQELAKCQRYFYRLQSDNSYGLLSDLGYVNSTSDVRVPIILPVPMRAKPSVSANGALRVFNAIDNNSMSTAVTLISPLHSIEGTLGHLRVTATNSDFVSGKIVALAANNDDNAYIDFSADL